MAGPDYILDLQSLSGRTGDDRRAGTADAAAGAGLAASDAGAAGLRGRPWVAIRWRCCGGYTRVYRNAEATAYEGRCPTCGRPVNLKVGSGGTDCRFFEAG